MIDAAELETGKHTPFKTLQKDVVFLTGLHFLCASNGITFFIQLSQRRIVDDANAHNELVSVIISYDNV